MSNFNLIIEERAADIGNFMVGRILPFRKKRAVGPFVFMDHMGPAAMKKNQNLDVLPHPHIGLSTLTYLFEGSIFHRDSIGSAVEIQPGDVNWMTAGKGIVHSERTPGHLRSKDKTLHGLQIWIGLPKALEQSEPSFHHIPSDQLPVWQDQHIRFKLIVGEVMEKKSPVPVHSPMYLLELKSSQQQSLDIGKDLFGESAIYILEGSMIDDGLTYGPGKLLVAKDGGPGNFEMSARSTIYILGGEPFPEKRFIHWNFVNSSKKILEQAKKDWKNQHLDAFPKIPGDENEFVPLPE